QSGHIRAALRNRHETSRHHHGYLRLQHSSARRDAASQPSSPPGTGTATREAARRYLSDDGEEVRSGVSQVRKTRIAPLQHAWLELLPRFPSSRAAALALARSPICARNHSDAADFPIDDFDFVSTMLQLFDSSFSNIPIHLQAA